jgi:phage terminase small subunit
MNARLTPKQRLFVECYLVHYNGTKAALEAGYSKNPDSARAHATKMLAKAHISEAVKLGQRRIIEKFEVDADMVVAGSGAIAFTNLDEVAPWDERGTMIIASADLPWRVRAAVKGLRIKRTRRVEGRRNLVKRIVDGVEIERAEDEAWEIEEVEWRMHDRVAALKMLGQHLGMRFGAPRIQVKDGGVANVDARAQSLLIAEKLKDMSPAEILEAAMRLPPEPNDD